MHLTQAMHTSQKSFDSLHVHSNGGSGVQRARGCLEGLFPSHSKPIPCACTVRSHACATQHQDAVDT